MAKEKLITRTISTTEATLQVYDRAAKKLEEKGVILAGTFKTDADILKAFSDIPANENYTPIEVISSNRIDEKYAVTISDFLKIAKKVEKTKNED